MQSEVARQRNEHTRAVQDMHRARLDETQIAVDAARHQHSTEAQVGYRTHVFFLKQRASFLTL